MARVELKELSWLPPEFWKEPAESIWSEVEYLGGDANSTVHGWPLLIEAVRHSSIETVELLLQKGADPNAIGHNPDGAWTALTFARRCAVVKLLIEYGADPLFAENELAEPPMWRARFWAGSEGEEVRALLRAAAGDRPFQKKGASFSCRKLKRGLTGLSAWRWYNDEERWHILQVDGDFDAALEACRVELEACTPFEWYWEVGGETRLLRQPEAGHCWAFRLVGNPWTTVVLAEFGHQRDFNARSVSLGGRRVVEILGVNGEMYSDGIAQDQKLGGRETMPEEDELRFEKMGDTRDRWKSELAYEAERADDVDKWLASHGCVVPLVRDRSTGFVAKMELLGVERKAVERVALLGSDRRRPRLWP